MPIFKVFLLVFNKITDFINDLLQNTLRMFEDLLESCISNRI